VRSDDSDSMVRTSRRICVTHESNEGKGSSGSAVLSVMVIIRDGGGDADMPKQRCLEAKAEVRICQGDSCRDVASFSSLLFVVFVVCRKQEETGKSEPGEPWLVTK